MNTYEWDAESATVVASPVQTKSVNDVRRVIANRGMDDVAQRFIEMSCVETGYESVEAEWYAAHTGGDSGARDTLEAEYPWLPTYRGEVGDEPPSATGERVRLTLIAAANAARDHYTRCPVSVDLPDLGESHAFDCDMLAQMRITAAVLLGQPQHWVTADNDTVSLTAADLQAVGAAMGARVAQAVLVARQHKDAVLAAADPLSVDITTGWPS